MIDRRTFLMAATAAGMQGFAATARADTFPNRAITLVVPYAAGGNGDFTARAFAEAFAKVIGQAVIVENRAGAGGAIGASYTARAKPDGYILIAAAKGVFSITPNLVDVTYGIDDFKPVGFISKAPMVLVVRQDSKFKTLEDFVAAAKRSPGKLTVGIGSMGSDNHVAMLHLQLATHCTFNPVAYKGSGPMLLDIMAGQIDAGVDQLTSSKPFFDSGKTRPLAVLGMQAEPMLPSVPTIAKIGATPFDSTTYIGLLAPRATPDATMAILQAAMKKALQDPKLIDGFQKAAGAVYTGTPGEFERQVKDESTFIKQMLREGFVQKQ